MHTFQSSSHSRSSKAFLCLVVTALTSDCTTLAFISTCSATAWACSILSWGEKKRQHTYSSTKPIGNASGLLLIFDYAFRWRHKVTTLGFLPGLRPFHTSEPENWQFFLIYLLHGVYTFIVPCTTSTGLNSPCNSSKLLVWTQTKDLYRNSYSWFPTYRQLSLSCPSEWFRLLQWFCF